MKLWIVGLFLLCVDVVFADQLSHKKSIGKPRVDAFFVDADVIRVPLNQTEVVDINIRHTADIVDYVVYASDGLMLQDISSSSNGVNTKAAGILSIPVKISVQQQGRFYIHVQITTQKEGVETKGVISKIVSSEAIEKLSRIKKQNISNKIHLLPSTETITKKTDTYKK